jgi:tRNA-dihydrouridine synthase B
MENGFKSLTLRGLTVAPALFCAPMAGVTHSAFRRLVAELGGYGALFTEMLSAKAVLNETFANSPYVRRRPAEGTVVYQLLISDTDRLDDVMAKIRSYEPAAVDVNLACAAREIRRSRAGAALFEDVERMQRVLEVVRRGFGGPLTAKIRLGPELPGWQEEYARRVAVIRNSGVDGVTLHPRFSEQKLRRHARYDLFAWAAREVGLPVIASGDLTGPRDIVLHKDALACASGIMIGRMAAVRPWVFAQWQGSCPAVDPAAIWMRQCDYIVEDFETGRRLPRIKIFTEYYSRNFLFGHTLYARVQSAASVEEARQRAAEFFAVAPEVVATPSVTGIS